MATSQTTADTASAIERQSVDFNRSHLRYLGIMSFNFKFSKVKAPSKLQPVKISLAEAEEKAEAKPEFVTCIDDNEVKIVEEKAPLVIPLIKNNVWRRKRNSDGVAVTDSTSRKDTKDRSPSTSDSTNVVSHSSSSNETSCLQSCANDNATKSLEEEATKELINEARSLLDVESSSSSKRVIPLPLLLQNKVPDGFEEDDNLDVSLRPDVPSEEDYERVPVSEFGMAMLRGMGFDEKKAVSVAPVEVTIRYKGLGLGADAPPPPPPPPHSSSLSIDRKTSKSDR